MKNYGPTLLISLLLTCFLQVGFAQQESTPYYYGQIGPEVGNFAGVSVAGNYIFNQKYSVQLGFQFFTCNPRELPDDFAIGFFDLIAFGTTIPLDKYMVYHGSFGRIINFSKHPKTRLNLMAGLGYTSYSYETNFEFVGGFGLISNYTSDSKNESSAIVLLQPKVEFCLSEKNGISVGPVVKFAKRENFYGFSVNYIFGKLRNSINRPKQ
ncbi:MAG TPA: hypothetical protein DEA82_12065 [Flavobacteriaceae bacterium]|nr:hypothetical protein [Flavobacteriaceae bacterium]HBR54867.1 hypothetical protein [Flavobacteriaceae bacterium]